MRLPQHGARPERCVGACGPSGASHICAPFPPERSCRAHGGPHPRLGPDAAARSLSLLSLSHTLVRSSATASTHLHLLVPSGRGRLHARNTGPERPRLRSTHDPSRGHALDAYCARIARLDPSYLVRLPLADDVARLLVTLLAHEPRRRRAALVLALVRSCAAAGGLGFWRGRRRWVEWKCLLRCESSAPLN